MSSPRFPLDDAAPSRYEFVDPATLRPGDTFCRHDLPHLYTFLGFNDALRVPGLIYLRILITAPDGTVSVNHSVGLEVPGWLKIRRLARLGDE